MKLTFITFKELKAIHYNTQSLKLVGKEDVIKLETFTHYVSLTFPL